MLTEAIEAEREAEAVTVTHLIEDAIVVTDTEVNITVAVAGLARALARLTMIVTIVRRIVRGVVREMTNGATDGNTVAADGVRRLTIVVNLRNPVKMNAIDAPFLCNSSLHD